MSRAVLRDRKQGLSTSLSLCIPVHGHAWSQIYHWSDHCCRSGSPKADTEMQFGEREVYKGSTPVKGGGSRMGQQWGRSDKASANTAGISGASISCQSSSLKVGFWSSALLCHWIWAQKGVTLREVALCTWGSPGRNWQLEAITALLRETWGCISVSSTVT